MQILKNLLIIALFSKLALFALPAAALSNMDGETVTMQAITGQGKWTVMKIWATDCHVCRSTMHHIVDFEMANPDVDVYGISLDDATGKKKVQKFIEEHGMDFPNLLSNPTEIDKYLYTTAKESFIGTPTFMVFDPEGELRAVQPGAVSPEALSTYIRQQSNK